MISDVELEDVVRSAILRLAPTLDLSDERLKDAASAINSVKVVGGTLVWPTDHSIVLLEHGDTGLPPQFFKSRVEKEVLEALNNAIAKAELF